MKRVTALICLFAFGCAGFGHKPPAVPTKPLPKFGASLIFPGGGSSGGGGGGSVTQGTSPWVTAIRDQGTLATVDFGDTTNKAARVNIVAGGSTPSDTTATGTIDMTNIASSVAVSCAGGKATVGMQFTGSWTGTIIFETTTDGSTWAGQRAYAADTLGTNVTTTPSNGTWVTTCSGRAQARARCSVAGSGTATATLIASSGSQTTATSVVGTIVNNSLEVGAAVTVPTLPALANAANPSWSENRRVFNSVLLNGAGRTDITTIAGTAPTTVGKLDVKGADGDVFVRQATASNLQVTANAGTNLNTSALALDTSVNALSLAQGSTTAGQKAVLHLGAVTTAAPSYTTAQSSPLSLTTTGLLRMDGSGVTQPVSGTVAATQSGAWSLSANQSVNVAQINGITPLMGNGVTGTGSPRVTIASDNTAFTVNAAESGTWTVQPGNTANTTGWIVGNTQGSTTSGQSGPLVQGAVTTAAPAYTTAQTSPLSLVPSGGLRFDLNSIIGTTALSGNGVTGVGSLRVTLASDTSTNTNPFNVGNKTNNNAAPGATNVGSLGALANASPPSWTEGNLVLHSVLLNGSQRNDVTSINGVTPLMGNGATGTGSQRVTIASDNTPFNVGVAQASTTSGQSGPLIQGAVTTANPTYTTAQTSPLSLDTTGALRVNLSEGTPWSFHEDSSSALTTTTVHAACGASLFNYVTSFAASSNFATVWTGKILDSTTTTILGPYALEGVAGRGFSVIYPGGKKQTTANTLISITTTGAIAHGIDVTGFCGP